ncbi:MAG: hypothetical protein MUE41_16800, partial [Gemmatimonadaceae bacterium]|nr:hypothetical protein [Gemmatimonadaceae bacterium]
ACADGYPPPCTVDGLRVLFIGNSLTYGNDVPRLVQQLAEQSRSRAVRPVMVAFPNVSLDDHWAQGAAAAALRRGPWDVVVLQQGPSSLPESRELLVAAARRFAPLIAAAGARAVLYEVWPTIARRADATRARGSYIAAAQAIDGVVAPAGTAWSIALAAPSPPALYDVDGLHASMTGSVLAALTLHARITGRDPRQDVGPLPGLGADTVLARRLRVAAAAAFDSVPP